MKTALRKSNRYPSDFLFIEFNVLLYARIITQIIYLFPPLFFFFEDTFLLNESVLNEISDRQIFSAVILRCHRRRRLYLSMIAAKN